MTQNSDPPTIDFLLKNSNWEERLAEARMKRDQVLAAKADKVAETPKNAIPRSEVALHRPVVPPVSASAPPGRIVLALAVFAGIVVGTAAGGLAVWVLWEGPGMSNAGSDPVPDAPVSGEGAALANTGATVTDPVIRQAELPDDDTVTRHTMLNPLSVARPQSRPISPSRIASLASRPFVLPIQQPTDMETPLPGPLAGMAARVLSARPSRIPPAPLLMATPPADAVPAVDIPGNRPTPILLTEAPQEPDVPEAAASVERIAAAVQTEALPNGGLPALQPAANLASAALPDAPPTAQSMAPFSQLSDVRIFVSKNTTQDKPLRVAALFRDAGLRPPDPIPLVFAAPRTDVRFYHAADAQNARQIAEYIRAVLRDFTGYAPAPRPGTIDVYLGQ